MVQLQVPRTPTIPTAVPQFSQWRSQTWVKLLELPNPYSDDEALLLCPGDGETWIAWIPNHGETVLSPSQFRSL